MVLLGSLNGPRVTYRNFRFSDLNELAKLHRSGSTLGTIYPNSHKKSKSDAIHLMSLDEFCIGPLIESIYNLKIDVDGAEPDFLWALRLNDF